MPICCAVYGYECTRLANIGDIELVPRPASYEQARGWARDKSTYHLTALLVGSNLTDSLSFEFEAILSFIEHLDVIVTNPQTLEGSDLFALYPQTIPTLGRNDGGGATLMPDTFSANSRPEFIESCLRHLSIDKFCADTQFRTLLFKKVETFRQRRPFLEVSYFLLYSGLESHARAVTEDRSSRNSSEPICKLLVSRGFDVSIERPAELVRAVSTYTHLRNALFHNSVHEIDINVNGSLMTLKIVDYYFNFLQLVTLVVMKAIAFDDGHINWNSWIDRQPFKPGRLG